eukprot:1089252-Amphidinium_carterae.2
MSEPVASYCDLVSRKVLQDLEDAYRTELRNWDVENARVLGTAPPRADKYGQRALDAELSRVRQASRVKAQTNRAVAQSVAESLHFMQRPIESARALILDGSEASTTSALASCGIAPWQIYSPNVIVEVAEQLRSLGVHSWAGRVEDLLALQPQRPLDLVYLDYTKSFPRQEPTIRLIFNRNWIAVGSIVAFTFSTRVGPWPHNEVPACCEDLPTGWSQAHAVYALFQVLLDAASEAGFVLEGADIAELDSYTLWCRQEDGPDEQSDAGEDNLKEASVASGMTA